MAIQPDEVASLYNKRARHYDISANLYYLMGFREQAYRKQAVQALKLKPGDTVVDLCCGTGLNFPLLRRAVGSSGHVIGVDLTASMLEQARLRIVREGWTNVELVQCNVADYIFPGQLNAVMSSFAITLVPQYDNVILSASRALLPGGHIAILDLKQPSKLPIWMTKLGVWLTRPFGVSLDLAMRHPWQSVQRYFDSVMMTEWYFGFVYLAAGEKRLAAFKSD